MPRYFEFDVSLRDIEPKIWRRFLLRDSATFLDLHYAIQNAGDWGNDHLFAFYPKKSSGDAIAGGDPLGGQFDGDEPAAVDVRLSSYFTARGRKCMYLYDFGDSWEVDITLKSIVESEEKFQRRLVGGARAFPMDDCGGLPGYYDCLVAVGAEKDDSYDPDELEERRGWLGDWSPESFDLEKARKEFDLPKAKEGKAK